ncbi:MAG: hypothetical protein IIZ67_02865 [Bacilli bacterium]|nr:hypothetical protein [Bacilli bacterium]
MNNNKKKNNTLNVLLIILNVALFILLLYVYSLSDRGCLIYSHKPIIYIYPKEDIDVKIKLSHPENLTTTYPKYENEWNVIARKDGTLIDKNNKKYYALYWESKENKSNPMKEDGFVVQKENLIDFLEEKLEILGLNYKESNEFIMYWLPILEKSEYNYIRFQTMEEINKSMDLSIDPKPDTLIRVRMEYKPLEKEIKVKEQKLNSVERKGYTVVEWGGTNIN